MGSRVSEKSNRHLKRCNYFERTFIGKITVATKYGQLLLIKNYDKVENEEI